ncbi:hypothetical protein PMI02_02861 [Novosphingobium sp. AP12]|nr:hypothetical protein PMI02_02861 [Novosphingobium sp. AP12]
MPLIGKFLQVIFARARARRPGGFARRVALVKERADALGSSGGGSFRAFSIGLAKGLKVPALLPV